MECLYKEDVDRIFTLDEPFEEMGSEAIEVHALKEEEFAQIVVLGLCVFFPNGDALSFVLWRVSTDFLIGIYLRPTRVKILPVGFHDCASFFYDEAREFTFESSIRYTTTHGWWPIPRLLIKVHRKRISDKRTKNQAKTDKTEHGIKEREKVKESTKVKPEKSKSEPKP
ncbi:hypothetical protein Tco_1328592 [Tanacetum coccineum]